MFKDSVPSKQRTDFIHYIKGIGNHVISDHELTQFIELPLGELNKRINMYSLDCFVYPTSGRSKLVSKMVSVLYNISWKIVSVIKYIIAVIRAYTAVYIQFHKYSTFPTETKISYLTN